MDEGLATTFAQLADDGRPRVPDARLTDGHG
jgi:hypothetical protein